MDRDTGELCRRCVCVWTETKVSSVGGASAGRDTGELCRRSVCGQAGAQVGDGQAVGMDLTDTQKCLNMLFEFQCLYFSFSVTFEFIVYSRSLFIRHSM